MGLAWGCLRAGDELPHPSCIAVVCIRPNAAGQGPVSSCAMDACIAILKDVYFAHLNIAGAGTSCGASFLPLKMHF